MIWPFKKPVPLDVESVAQSILEHAPDDPKARAMLIPEALQRLWDEVARVEEVRRKPVPEAEIEAAQSRLSELLTGVPMPPRPAPDPKPDPVPPTADEIRKSLAFLVGETFSTTVDGSTECADDLASLALTRVDEALAAHTHLSRKDKRSLRTAAEQDIARERVQVLI